MSNRLNDHIRLSREAAETVLPIIQAALTGLAQGFAAKPFLQCVRPTLTPVFQPWSDLEDVAIMVNMGGAEDRCYALWLETGSDLAAEEGDIESSLDYWNVEIEQPPMGRGNTSNLLRTTSRNAAIGAFINHIALDVAGHVIGKVLKQEESLTRDDTA